MPSLQDLGFSQYNTRTLSIDTQIADLNIPDLSLGNDTIESLSVNKLRSETISSKQITLGIEEGKGDVYIAAGKTDFDNTVSGFILGLDDSDSNKAKFYIGDTTSYFNWTGTTVNVAGANIDNSVLTDLAVGSEISIQGWQFSGTFSSTDYNTVSWTSGTITLLDGTTFAISLGDTGNMVALTYIYFSKNDSQTVLQVTTTAASAVGSNKILMAVAQNNSDTTSQSIFQVFGGSGGQLLTVNNIAANSASTNEFISNTAQIKDLIVTNAKINDLAVSKLTAGTITSKIITLAINEGAGDVYIGAGKTDFVTTGAGFILGIDDSDSNLAKFYLGDTAQYLYWDGIGLNISGTLSVTTVPGLPDDGVCIARWSLDEGQGSTAIDSTRNGHNGALSNATYATGVSGSSLSFNGTTSYVQVPDAPDLQNIFDGGGSVSVWIDPLSDGENDAGRIFSKINGTNGWELLVRLEFGGFVTTRFSQRFSGSNGIWDSSTSIVPNNSWSHICVVYNSDSVSNDPIVYLNGNPLTLTESSTPSGTRQTDAGLNLYIGNYSTNDNTFDGQIDEARLYNRTLTSNEVIALHKNPSGVSQQGVKQTGGQYATSASNPRLLIFPDSNTGLQIIDNAGADVFKALVGGTDVGDIIIGAEASSKYVKWDKSASIMYVYGSLVTQSGSSLDGTYLAAGSVTSSKTNVALQGWSLTVTFWAPDYNTIGWFSGTITTSNGTSYSIDAGNSGDIVALTYIYLDIAISSTVLQITTTSTSAVGDGKLLLAVAQNNSDTSSKASFQVFGGKGGNSLFVDNLAANIASTNEFVSNTAQIANLIVTNAKINDLVVSKLTAGTISSKAFTLAITEGTGDCYFNAGKTDFNNTVSGFILGLDDSDSNRAKFYIGDATTYLNWTGTGLVIKGNIATDTGSILNVGSLSGWTLSSTEFSNGNIKIQSSAERILLGSATAPLTGTGIFLGKDGSDYELRAGNPSGQYCHWDGTNWYTNGKTVAQVGSNIFGGTVITGSTIVGTAIDHQISSDGTSYTPNALYQVERDSSLIVASKIVISSVGTFYSERSAQSGLTLTSEVGIVVVGSFVYYSYVHSGLSKIDRSPLTGMYPSTSMTLSGGSDPRSGRMASDGTNLYILTGTTTVKKFTISGTTITYDSSITLAAVISATQAFWCDGTYFYGIGAANTMKKFALAGTLVSTSTTVILGIETNMFFSLFGYGGSGNFALGMYNLGTEQTIITPVTPF